jgi:hypothetical protein
VGVLSTSDTDKHKRYGMTLLYAKSVQDLNDLRKQVGGLTMKEPKPHRRHAKPETFQHKLTVILGNIGIAVSAIAIAALVLWLIVLSVGWAS